VKPKTTLRTAVRKEKEQNKTKNKQKQKITKKETKIKKSAYFIFVNPFLLYNKQPYK